MQPKSILTAFSVAALIICVNFIAVPEFWIRLYGATADSQSAFLYRLIGALFGGLAVMAWRGRSAGSSTARHAMFLGLIVLNALLTLVAVLGALTHVYNQFAWGPVAMFGAFAIGFARPARDPSQGLPAG